MVVSLNKCIEGHIALKGNISIGSPHIGHGNIEQTHTHTHVADIDNDNGDGNNAWKVTHKMEAKSENVLYVYLCRLFGPIPPSDPYSETRPLITH